ncbi:MAG: hypothetical protein KBG67_06125 [Candidatus Atribacteria bacterium]|nr:hypothetical protein [Candidatus Atribacteria bacterium]
MLLLEKVFLVFSTLRIPFFKARKTVFTVFSKRPVATDENYSYSSVAKWSLRIFDEALKYCPLVATILFQDITLMEVLTLLLELF